MSDPSASYDDVPYDSYAFPQSHPGRLATIAALFGMEPHPLVSGARVLEVGCAGGGNFLPIAAAYPQSQFVGVDISAVQIAKAREAVDALSLRNVTLLCRGLEGLDAAAAGGSFDYIIAHGVYSWVAAPVREELLALCARLLKPRGIAYISFNTLPGSRVRETLRDILRYHTSVRPQSPPPSPDQPSSAPLPPLAERVTQARALFAVLGEAFESREDPYARATMEELSHAAGQGDFYIAHEHLEGTNDPCYFHEFIAHSQRHGLQYLGDAEMQTMAAPDVPASVRNHVRAMAASIEEAEQYQDFIRNRAFRQTLLCRADIPLKRTMSPDLVQRFHFASHLRPATDANGVPSPEDFCDPAGTTIAVPDALARAALLELLAAWPAPLSFFSLLQKAAARARIAPDPRQAALLARALLTCYSALPAMELHLFPPAFQTTVSAHPLAPDFIRWQAAHSHWITNLRHENLGFNAPERVFISKLDGTRSLPELEQEFPNAREVLENLARLALLVG